MHKTLLQVDLPQGLCVVGDAATCFNPIYGQGMTVGIKGAILLRDTLQKRLQGRTFSSASAASALSGFSKVWSQGLLLHVILKNVAGMGAIWLSEHSPAPFLAAANEQRFRSGICRWMSMLPRK